jgi:hypothetical protein
MKNYYDNLENQEPGNSREELMEIYEKRRIKHLKKGNINQVKNFETKINNLKENTINIPKSNRREEALKRKKEKNLIRNNIRIEKERLREIRNNALKKEREIKLQKERKEREERKKREEQERKEQERKEQERKDKEREERKKREEQERKEQERKEQERRKNQKNKNINIKNREDFFLIYNKEEKNKNVCFTFIQTLRINNDEKSELLKFININYNNINEYKSQKKSLLLYYHPDKNVNKPDIIKNEFELIVKFINHYDNIQKKKY